MRETVEKEQNWGKVQADERQTRSVGVWLSKMNDQLVGDRLICGC